MTIPPYYDRACFFHFSRPGEPRLTILKHSEVQESAHLPSHADFVVACEFAEATDVDGTH